ncbi:ABC transporter substrate-binding protein [Sciscionella sediminilitoris]|uniref:ABC transporter substrate-binding protein n=1 Tax=Sciscionella sediminilitoris TaxID=1445613 RepID=UPI0004DEE683|nr:ABC transporter substrate-binding protein [Sciscionella sp. SE31]
MPRSLGLLAVLLLLAGCAVTPDSRTAAVPDEDVLTAVRAVPALHAELPAGLRARGTLLLGTPPTPGTSSLPHGGRVHGRDVGLDVDLRMAVAKVLGVRLTVARGTFATIVPGVQNGKYDVGQGNFAVTRARERAVDFATYLHDGQSFLVSAGVRAARIRGLADLCGYTVATSPGSTFQQILDRGTGVCAAHGKEPYTAQYFPDTGPIFLGLANGKVDVYFGPSLSLRYDAAHIPGTRLAGEYSSTPVGFVTAKGSPLAPALRDAVNHLITTGQYGRILRKWGVGGGVRESELNPPAAL